MWGSPTVSFPSRELRKGITRLPASPSFPFSVVAPGVGEHRRKGCVPPSSPFFLPPFFRARGLGRDRCPALNEGPPPFFPPFLFFPGGQRFAYSKDGRSSDTPLFLPSPSNRGQRGCCSALHPARLPFPLPQNTRGWRLKGLSPFFFQGITME